MLLYLIPAVGVTVTLHYCEGEITSSSFNPLDFGQPCSCGSKKMDKDCCQNETTSVRTDDDQQKTQFTFNSLEKLSKIQASTFFKLVSNSPSPLLIHVFNFNAHPPDELKHPLYLRYSVFRI